MMTGIASMNSKLGLLLTLNMGLADSSPSRIPKQDDEFLKLEFAKGAYIYVNILHANRIAPYISFGEQATQLDELGTKKWQNRKQKAIKNIEIIAAKLLEVAQKQKMVIREKFALRIFQVILQSLSI